MYKNFCSARAAIMGSLLAASLMLPLTAQSASPEVEEIMERYEQEKRDREAQRAEDERLEALDKLQVEKELAAYVFPLEQSRCGDFMVDWKQVTTVQTYIQLSLSHAKSLGNCLHAETKMNVEALASELKESNIGVTQWSRSGSGMPDSIGSIAPFAYLKANHDRCSFRCFDTFNNLLDKAANISKKKSDMFLAQWDQYTDNNIKPALKTQDPVGYENNKVAEEFAKIRDALEHFSYQANKPAP